MLKIKGIDIEGIGGIDKLHLNFKPGLNLICGPNGVGKTTILECIAQSFSSIHTDIIRRNVNHKKGFWKIEFSEYENTREHTISKNKYHPYEGQEYVAGFSHLAKNIIVFKTHRNINYINLSNISKDPKKSESTMVSENVSTGATANEIKNWIVSRFMWSAHEGYLSEEQINNFNKATDCFNTLDNEVTFSRVLPDSFDILVETPNGEIYFEYLSSGYKSSLHLLIGLIKDIEHRFKDPKVKIQDFDGIILIDEIDLHLHPQWQAKLIYSIKKLIPKAQIIATTHSPSIIQIAESQELIPLGFNEKKQVSIREIPCNEYGFQGWTIEEILTDVMGLKEIRSEKYLSEIRKFDMALDNEDYKSALISYNILEKMLHPQNHLIKLLKIQLASLGRESRD